MSMKIKRCLPYTIFSLELEPHNHLQDLVPSLHLQWFAAEDEGRTFDPTERKIQKSREEGRVAKTQEIPSSLILIGVVGLVWIIGSYYVENFKFIISSYFSRLNTLVEYGFANEGVQFGRFMWRLIWPIGTLTIVLGILGNVLQFGWVVSTKPLTPNFSKVAFKVDKWIEKIISVQGWYNTATSILKIAIVSIIVIINIYLNLDKISGIIYQPFTVGISLGIRIAFLVLLESGFCLLALALIDYQFQKSLFMEQLKMSFEEIKEDIKSSEGDQTVKRRIQDSMREFLSRNVKQEVSRSDVLITNPTHFAISLLYDANTMDLPMVTAKGEDQFALLMRRIAKEADVPIIENKPLARALYADLQVGDEIPEKYYGAVVIVFKEVYKMKGVYANG